MNSIRFLDTVIFFGGIETYSVCRLNSIGQQVPGTGTFLLERNSSHGLSVDPSNCLSAHPIALRYGHVTACVHAPIFQHKKGAGRRNNFRDHGRGRDRPLRSNQPYFLFPVCIQRITTLLNAIGDVALAVGFTYGQRAIVDSTSGDFR